MQAYRRMAGRRTPFFSLVSRAFPALMVPLSRDPPGAPFAQVSDTRPPEVVDGETTRGTDIYGELISWSDPVIPSLIPVTGQNP